MANYHEMDRDALTAEKAAGTGAYKEKAQAKGQEAEYGTRQARPTRWIWQWTC